jgi:signal transduction histidine kinase
LLVQLGRSPDLDNIVPYLETHIDPNRGILPRKCPFASKLTPQCGQIRAGGGTSLENPIKRYSLNLDPREGLKLNDICRIIDDLKYQFQGVSWALNIEFRLTDLPKSAICMANELEIADAISSIVHNAFSVCNSGDIVFLDAYKEPDWLYIIVSDTGPGITQDHEELIFGENYPRRNVQAFSKNLFEVRESVERVGGKAWAGSIEEFVGRNVRVAHGACFVIAIPNAE